MGSHQFDERSLDQVTDALQASTARIESVPPMQAWDELTGIIRFLDRELRPRLATEGARLSAVLVGEASLVSALLRLHRMEIGRRTGELEEARKGLLFGDSGARRRGIRALAELHALVVWYSRARNEILIPFLSDERSAAQQLHPAVAGKARNE